MSVSESGEIQAAFSRGGGDLSQVSELSQNSFMNSPLFRWLQGTVEGGPGFRFSG